MPQSSKQSLPVLIMKVSLFPYLFVSLYMVGHCAFPSAQSQSNLYSFEQWLRALSRTIDFMIQRPSQMNVDAVFGLTIAEAHVAAALSHANAKELKADHMKVLHDIRNVSERARLNTLPNITPENEDVALLHRLINRPEMWMYPIHWKKEGLDRPTLKIPTLVQRVLKSIYKGTPKEKESDWCLSELFRNQLGNMCPIPMQCAEMLVRNDDANGYPLTHRLLFILTVNAMGCQTQYGDDIYDLVPQYCSIILQNLVDIELAGFPGVSRDLAMEEVLLCGMAGYEDFLHRHYAKLITGWQHQHGCFPNSKTYVMRRSTKPTDFGCDIHATGLGSASLALLIRHEIENNL